MTKVDNPFSILAAPFSLFIFRRWLVDLLQTMSSKETLNPLAVAKLLGPSTPTLDHLIRFLNTVRGTDKVLMVCTATPFYSLPHTTTHNQQTSAAIN